MAFERRLFVSPSGRNMPIGCKYFNGRSFMLSKTQPVDHAALKINQITIIILNLTAFVFDEPWLAFTTALFLLAGTFIGKPGFLFIYSRILRPSGLAKPRIYEDNPEPHRFSQGLGGTLILAGSLALMVGATLIGWTLIWLVTALAALNAFGGFCAGCFTYYWLARFKIPGFNKLPPEGTFPGMRPKEMEANES
jgi:hypothetical protein